AVTRGNTPFAASASGSSGFRVIDVQSVAQSQADRWGSAFTDLFVVLGAFSLFSGMLLIVLVFSLVALERRTELGISRALGARRRDVILLLAIEGGLYSLISSLFGLGAGLALALGIITLAQGLVEQYGFHLEPVVEPASLAASYGLGVVLTFVAVTATAWRSSRFSIVTAIRDLPDPVPAAPGWRSLAVSLIPALGGPLMVVYAVLHRLSVAYAVGIAVAIVGAALLARWLCLTLRMFALVVLSLTVSAVLLTATRTAYADPEAVTGGWDIHITSSRPPRDLRADLAAYGVVSADAFSAIGAASPLLIEAIQTDAVGASRWASVNVLAVDDAFLQASRTPIVAGNGWNQLSRPRTAIVGAGLLRSVPNRLRVIDSDGRDFHPITLWLRDTRGTHATVRVEVVGLADARGPFGNAVVVNAASLSAWPQPENAGYY